MRTLSLLILLCLAGGGLFAQGVGINPSGGTPDPTAGLDINFSDKGLLMPRLTEAQRDAISNPAQFLAIMNTDSECMNIYIGSAWKQLCPECIQGAPTPGSNSPVCEGGSLNLTATTIPGATYNWTGPNGYSSFDQDPMIANATPADSGTYTVTATLNGCTSIAASIEVTVYGETPSPTAGSNSPVCAGNALNLTASAVSGATYSWTGPNGFSSSDQNPTISNTVVADSGNYIVTATKNGCVSAPDTVHVIIHPTDGGSAVYTHTGGDQSFVVPACYSSISVKMWGAGGGGATNIYTPFAGGGGGYAAANLPVTAGETLTVIVGGGGAGGIINTAVPGGYGGGGTGAGGNAEWGLAAGGGRSAIRRNTTELLTAGGGGGGGGQQGGPSNMFNTVGGAGGGLVGGSGAGTSGSPSGQGGTQSAGGAVGGSQFQGGSISNWGGGGGGGYYGGGHGAIVNSSVTGGGGGSGYDSTGGGTLTAGSGATPGNAGDSDRNGAGQGGAAGSPGNAGAHGRVLISW